MPLGPFRTYCSALGFGHSDYLGRRSRRRNPNTEAQLDPALQGQLGANRGGGRVNVTRARLPDDSRDHSNYSNKAVISRFSFGSTSPSFAAVRPARGAGSALFGISGSARLYASSVTMFSSQQLYVSDQDQPCIAFVAGPAAFWLPPLQAVTHRLGPSHPPPQCCSVFLLTFHMKGPADFRPPHRARLVPVMYNCIFFCDYLNMKG